LRSSINGDEQAIRRGVADWQVLTAGEDVEWVLALMADDAVFLVAGHPPMRGRARFETNLRQVLNTHRIESTADVQEVVVSGNLAYCWSMLSVRMTPRAGGATTLRTGSVLTILRKRDDGAWVLSRDANLLAASS
jgi:uncharacterized protein (TIGR02246 family)